MNAEQLKDMQEVVENAKANALRFPEISFDDLEALVKLGFECLKLREQQRWIPVSERLPDEAGEYLCVGLDSDGQHYSLEWYLGGEWRVFYCEITHWMPLPEAPVGEQA